MTEKTLFWYLQDNNTGAWVTVGSFSDVTAGRNRIAADWRSRGFRVKYFDRRRRMTVWEGVFKIGSWTIGRVTVPAWLV